MCHRRSSVVVVKKRTYRVNTERRCIRQVYDASLSRSLLLSHACVHLTYSLGQLRVQLTNHNQDMRL